MIRVINLVAVMAVILSSFSLYRVKQEARAEAYKVAEVRRDIAREEEAIDILKAEWSYLNQPSRIQDLAGRYLELKPTDVHQIVTLQDLPQRPREENPYGAEARVLGGFAGGDVTGSVR